MSWSCPATSPAPLVCPTLEQSIDATLALLPRGRTWPANDRSILARFLDWLGALSGAPPPPSGWPVGFGQVGFFAAFGAVRNFLETQLCALRLEFWCATETLTNDLWLAEYGLPDACDPFPNLCVKVAALGGRRCELYQALVEQYGWLIDCITYVECANPSLSGQALSGQARASGGRANVIIIVVYLSESPAYVGGIQTPPLAGRLLAGLASACAPDISQVQCLMERIAPAHVVVDYQTVA